MQGVNTQPAGFMSKGCSHTCHRCQPCQALLRRQKPWSNSQSKLAPKGRAQRLTSRQHVRHTRAVHSQSTVPKLDQEFQAWWQNAGVAADALSPSEFAGKEPEPCALLQAASLLFKLHCMLFIACCRSKRHGSCITHQQR